VASVVIIHFAIVHMETIISNILGSFTVFLTVSTKKKKKKEKKRKKFVFFFFFSLKMF